MDIHLLPSLPPSPDPVLCEDWEEQLEPAVQPSSSYSDDLEALHLVRQETILEKTKRREVIQHRAWPLEATFRSEADYPQGKI
ncbi:hypothetical protein B0O99DRAFT_508717 [Bisporella sp. PMI_857]|nr:hypothetical protein B0O99DRAFT_508717 [Bisporella sp. PMI_857]